MNDFIPVTRPLLPPLSEYIKELEDIWDKKYLTNNGPKYQALEKGLKEYMDVPNISLFANGHLALQIAIRALELKGEIITTPFTFASTTHAIVECGCTPVFCDIDPVTLTIDVNKIESLITDKTSAILAVHVYGTACDTERLQQIADKYNLKLIYDAAHTFSEKIDGVGIGNFGDISMFSFHATKVFNTVEGGCLTYRNSALKEKIEAIEAFGFQKNTANAMYVGTNAKMTEVSAAMGICNLRYVDKAIEKRKQIFEQYNKRLKNIKGVKLLANQDSLTPNYSYYPVIFNSELCGTNRDIVADALEKQNIIPRKYFAPLTSDFSCYKDRFSHGETPVADFVSENVLVLPLYADLDLSDCDRICDIILNEVNNK